MSQDQTMIFIICYSIAAILLYKYIKYRIKIKTMEGGVATCTDTTLRTTYQKNIRYYYYEYTYNGEKYSAADKTRFKIPGFNPERTKAKQV